MRIKPLLIFVPIAIFFFWVSWAVPTFLNRASREKHEKYVGVVKPSWSFVIESGPDEIGFSQVYVIRHKETGRRFVMTQRGSGGTTVTPLLP
jgi:hypothetical protein